MKKVISISLAGALVISTIWWLNRGGDDRTALITVGIDGPIPDSMVFDPSEMNAADLYLEETPDTRMTFRRMYYELKPEVSTSLFLEAMADGVQFFITTQPSTLAVESRHLFTNGSALLINTSSTSPLLSGQDDHILRIIPDARSEQAVMARLLNGLSARRVLILQDESNPRYTDPAYAFSPMPSRPSVTMKSPIANCGWMDLSRRPTARCLKNRLMRCTSLPGISWWRLEASPNSFIIITPKRLFC